ncbi:MAG TPA: aminotransferase class V-fold PLP-dependent enzyme [Acidimicrobiales bacterium]|jgi:glutamate/tyrosine decarboxylase-like PLP-dependent enzyme|nr:aminotransferase class V-fold PLP-dependent enzyme [Acidimicrobiales bacterium]
MADYPYADRFEIHRTLPEKGMSREEVMDQLTTMATEEDTSWEGGKVSGTMYCGDHDHYHFMNGAFGLFAHVNVLQRDICPSATKFEAEIISMVLDLHHGEAAVANGDDPCGLVTSGGTGSISHAVLAYREHAAQTRGVTRPNMIKPETAHPAFDKACHLFGVELRRAPVNPVTTKVDVDWVRDHIDDQTVALVGSACNYGYGTVDPISELSDVALEHGIGLHVDGCLGGLLLPFGQELGYDIPVFDYRIPGVTSISADTHKYGYAFKGSSVVSFRTKALRNSQYFFLTDWSGGKYCSPGMDGSRSGGIIAATWAAMVQIGRAGYLGYAKAIFDTSAAMQAAVRSHPELRMMGDPTFLFSFTSDEFDVYHINDFMRLRGWRFNGQQYPNALHMAVTRPQTQEGVAEAFATDLAEAVDYAKAHAAEDPKSSAIYGGVAGGMTNEADEFIRAVMADMMDSQSFIPTL